MDALKDDLFAQNWASVHGKVDKMSSHKHLKCFMTKIVQVNISQENQSIKISSRSQRVYKMLAKRNGFIQQVLGCNLGRNFKQRNS